MKQKQTTKNTLTSEIPEGWEVKRIGDLCRLITSGGTPSRRNELYWMNGNIPWLKTQELCDNNIYDAEEKINDVGLKNSSAKVMPINTISMAMYGATVGKLGIFKKEMSTNQACCNMVINESKADYRFIYYELLKNRDGLINLASGAAQQNLNQDIIKNYELLVPSLPAQHVIAKILSDLDDKIELNHRMNKTLEAIGQVLFKRWFVDFKFPGHEKIKFINKIPEDWRVSKVGHELFTVLGGTPAREKSEYWDNGTIPWINSGKANEFRVTEPNEFITEDGLNNSATKLMPEKTTIIAITGATLGQVSLLEIPTCANQSIVGVLPSEKIPSEFIYFWIKNNIGKLISWQTGGAQQHINKNNVNDLDLLCPAEKVMQEYIVMSRPLFEQIKFNCFEAKYLTLIRDSLLPKLMSGKIRITLQSAEVKKSYSPPVKETYLNATPEFIESIIISLIVKNISTPQYPLGRMRYNKLAYFAHRKAGENIEEYYLQKAAGPYSPWARYKGPEAIAIRNGYVKRVKNEYGEGLLPGSKIEKINKYINRYPSSLAVEWVVQNFRYKKKEELELLSTVDFAIQRLVKEKNAATLAGVKYVISSHKEWAPKLNRAIFSDENIKIAMTELNKIFS